jgi:hypothetical protein
MFQKIFPAPCLEVDPMTWTKAFINPCDDCSTEEIQLGFTFFLYGDTYTSVFINSNGNLSFLNSFRDFTASDFPATEFVMVAPFWADVDIRNGGDIYYKMIDSSSLAVAWVNVARYGYDGFDEKINTFQVLITDGMGSIGGTEGASSCSCFNDMQWTTGEADSGVDGFGGVPATVGANKGVRIVHFSVFCSCLCCNG